MAKPPIVDITHPLILKDGELFFLCDGRGEIDPAPELGLGLFYRDCRFLCRYALRLGGKRPLSLMQSAAPGFAARFELTNPAIDGAHGQIPEHALAIARIQTVAAEGCSFHDSLSLRNCTLDALEFELQVVFEARFEDVFALRGTKPKRRGRLCPPVWRDGSLCFRYEGADGIERRLEVAASPAASTAHVEEQRAALSFPLRITPQETVDLDIAVGVREAPGDARKPSAALPPAREAAMARDRHQAQHWLQGYARIESDDAFLDATLHRSLADIRLLTIEREGDRFIAAGVPWFVALFGRDSLVPALQCLCYRPDLAAHTLRLLARRQGERYASEQREQPGKILHELRVGEMARLGEVGQHPGYGSIDSTLLYLIALARHAQWSGSTALFEELRQPVERALDWIGRDGDSNGDGYIDYDAGEDGPPANQGWKDSADAVTYPNGEAVHGRIALAEVQGYAYLAKRLIAALYERIGDSKRADRLSAEAEALRERFNRDFWMEGAGCYCLALDQYGKQVEVISSNPGQVLWSGIADPHKARAVADRLMMPDMFSGWGIRTLSERAARFNPIGYHTGSVWPFDNSFIAAGFRRYGFDDHALRLFTALLEAARYFDYLRLPEFFSGAVRHDQAGPARCPRADPLQAWSSGALPYMLTSLLGLEGDGFAQRLRLVRPILPQRVERIELKGLRVGEATADLAFERRAGEVEVSVLRCQGKLELEA